MVSAFIMSQIEDAVDPVVQLKLLCSAGGELCIRYDCEQPASRGCQGVYPGSIAFDALVCVVANPFHPCCATQNAFLWHTHNTWWAWSHATIQTTCPMEPKTPAHVQVKVDCTLLHRVYTFFCLTSEMGRCSGAGVEWNHQFSLLVDDANVEMLEILILDGYSPQGCQKPIARCKIPLMR